MINLAWKTARKAGKVRPAIMSGDQETIPPGAPDTNMQSNGGTGFQPVQFQR
jgi:hypothetical protein